MGKIGRNDPCHCGSGRKYKHCCIVRDRQFAGRVFQNVLATEPRNPEGVNALGLLALEAGQYDAAITLMRRAVDGSPHDPAYRSNLGLAYKAAGRFEEAVVSLRAALARDAGFVAARVNLGGTYAELGRFEDALVEFRRAANAEPRSAAAHNGLGLSLLSLGKAEEALDSFRAALRLDAADAVVHNNLGNALHQLGRFPEAIEAFEKALARMPDNALMHCNLAKALSHFGKVEDAAARYRAAIALEAGLAEAHNGLGVMLMELGRKEEALASVRNALALNPERAEAYFNLHSLLIDSRDLRPAIESLRRYISLRPGDQEASVQLHALIELAERHENEVDPVGDPGQLTPAGRELLEAWRYMKKSLTETTEVLGLTHDGFRIGLERATIEGLVLEFGVGFGVSIRQIAELARQDVHGFDTFEGLPEAWHAEPRGSYSTLGNMPEVPANAILHKGLFEHTLSPFLEAHTGPVRFMNIDCDIYSATRTVLDRLAERIVPGTVIAFDEYLGNEHWREDEFRAFQEFVGQRRQRYEYLCFSLCTRQAVVRML